MNRFLSVFTFLVTILVSHKAVSQKYRTDTLPPFKVIAANPVYKTSGLHQFLWGKNYRKEWSTPIRVPVALLDTLAGGLTPTKAGGGNQTQSLQLESRNKKDYSLRSVNKTLGKVIPKDFHGTFIEDLVNDKVSMSHPYAAVAVPVLAQSINVYHSKPSFVYLPKQPALDTFPKYGNETYLFEQRIAGNWSDAAHLGNFSKFHNTLKVMEEMKEDNDHQVDQKAFIKARLFDMLINDWDRHEDQWEWGVVEKGDMKIYKPVPKDRDQAFFKYDGVLLKLLFAVSGINYMQPFKSEMKDVKTFNYEERNLDRFFANQMTLADWQSAAKEIQQGMSDNVIEKALQKLPAEIHPISNSNILSKLRTRRDDLEKYATEYYHFLAKEVDVPGSESKEHFRIKQLNNNTTQVDVHKINKEGVEMSTPFYTRTFTADETKEVRVYGISNNDKYTVEQNNDNKTQLRIIGGIERDDINITGKGRVHVYDNKDNAFNLNPQSKLHLSEDTSINSFKYNAFIYDKKGISPVISFNNEDRIFVGLGYKILNHKWRKEPFASKHTFSGNYSITQRAVSATYKGLVPNFVGKWNLDLLANYDVIRWTNFFGLGNESKFAIDDIDYYRARSTEWLGLIGLNRKMGNSTLKLNTFFRSVRILDDTSRFVSKVYRFRNADVFETDNFAGAEARYQFHSVNDNVVPTKGISLFGDARFTQNVKEVEKSVANFSAQAHFYLPFTSAVSIAVRGGGATLAGTPEFYQYSSIGGSQTMRAFRRDRFWGKSSLYVSNELRLIGDVKSYLFNGKLGVFGFYENGRVWLPGENSDTWHSGYGAGIIIAPFNKAMIDVSYGVSKDEGNIQVRLGLPLK